MGPTVAAAYVVTAGALSFLTRYGVQNFVRAVLFQATFASRYHSKPHRRYIGRAVVDTICFQAVLQRFFARSNAR